MTSIRVAVRVHKIAIFLGLFDLPQLLLKVAHFRLRELTRKNTVRFSE